MLIRSTLITAALLALAQSCFATTPAAKPAATAPSFNCAKASGQAQQLVCKDAELAQLDREIARLYGLASTGPDAKRYPELKAMQRGWIKGRDDCWKSDDARRCVRDAYALRIAELRALPDARRHDAKLGEKALAIGPLPLRCPTVEGEVVVTFINSDPGAVVLRTAQGSVVLDHLVSASGARYGGKLAGGDYLLWNKGRDYRLELPGAPAAECTDAAP